MSISRAKVSSISELAAWMQENAVPSIFKSVTYENDHITATDEDDNVVLEIKNNNGGYFRAFRGENNYFSIGMQYIVKRNSESDIIGCDNGFIFSGECEDQNINTRSFAFLCSKTNNGKVAIVFPSSYVNNPAKYITALHHVAWGDSATISSTTTFTPESGQQTSFTVWKTNVEFGDVSYTPNAYYLDMHTNYSSGIAKLLLNGDTFITNGYWAIKDGGTT